MRVLEIRGDDPRQWGRAHGEELRPLIAELAAIRAELCVEIGAFGSEDEVLGAARLHLPVLERFDRALFEELSGIAEGAGLEPARVVVLNHYTDLRDLDTAALEAPGEEDCSAVYARTDDRALLGQTWDMHGSAEPYVMMLRVPSAGDAPAAWLFSITGCLGMTGMNDAGVGITINNLKSVDAQVGVVWPALVRRALRERSAQAARDVVMGAPLGSGHHYLVADEHHAFGIETSGRKKKIVFEEAAASYVHTNHCLDPEMAGLNRVGPESTTHDRYELLQRGIIDRPVVDRPDLWLRLGSHEGYPRSVCTHMATPFRPHAMRTCGAIVMDLVERDAWAAPGCVHLARPHVFTF